MFEVILRTVESLGISGILALFGYKLLEQLLTRDLKRFEADLKDRYSREVEKERIELRAAAFEHEVRYTKLHEKRALVTAELYRQLANTDLLWRACLDSSLKVGKTDSELQQDTFAASCKLYAYFDQHRIFFDSGTSDDIDRFCGSLRSAFTRIRLNPMTAKELADDTAEYVKVIPDVRKRIEKQLRAIVGFKDDSDGRTPSPLTTK